MPAWLLLLAGHLFLLTGIAGRRAVVKCRECPELWEILRGVHRPCLIFGALTPILVFGISFRSMEILTYSLFLVSQVISIALLTSMMAWLLDTYHRSRAEGAPSSARKSFYRAMFGTSFGTFAVMGIPLFCAGVWIFVLPHCEMQADAAQQAFEYSAGVEFPQDSQWKKSSSWAFSPRTHTPSWNCPRNRWNS